LFDCHVHSNFSFDSNLAPQDACEKAIKLGFEGIAFVDHLDFDFPGYDDIIIDFNKYSSFMEALKKRYKGRLEIIKGIEVGIQPHVIESSSAIVEKHDFDFAIGSIHILDGLDPYRDPYYCGKSKIEAYEGYLKEILFMIENYDNFDVSAHFDYIVRCADYTDNSMKYCEHSDLFDAIFRLLISKGKGFEVNTGSFRKRTNNNSSTPEYDIEILKRYRELGGEIICLGSDAHSIEFIGYGFDYFKEMVKSAGFKYLTRFKKRKPVFTAID